jgi:hypothetical protein
MTTTAFIPQKHLKRNGKVDLWDMGPPDESPEYAAWEALHGGPIKIEQWAVDARHTLTIESKRYKLTLPKGIEPGRAQREADERATAEGDQQEAADPHFGTGQNR